jgi:hypothetical protein
MISGVFLQDTVTFQHLSCRMLRDPVAGIFDLGFFTRPVTAPDQTTELVSITQFF